MTNMNKVLLALSLSIAAPTAYAAAPTPGYVQVQTAGTTDTTPGKADGAAEKAAATGQAVDNTKAAVNNTVDPNHDGVVDSNNNGVADTREFPWGLLGLLGLFGLMGRNRPAPVVTTTGTTVGTDRR